MTVEWRMLADLGFSFFPVPTFQKRATMKWERFQNSRPTAQEVDAWSRRESNVAIVTGAISGCVVLDIDTDEGAALVREKGVPRTPTVQTSKGRHIYFRHPGFEVRNFARRLTGCDLRGDGGYVIGPGSIHETGVVYTPEIGFDVPLADMPQWLLDAARKSEPRDRPPQPTGQRTKYVEGAIDGELSEIRRAPEGARNNTLNIAAFKLGTLVGAGQIERGYVESQLLHAALACGLEREESIRTIKSGLDGGEQDPRQIPDRPPPRGRAALSSRGENVVYMEDHRDASPDGAFAASGIVKATPYTWVAPETIPIREWVYGRHLIRRFVSATIAPGGVGKTSLAIAETLAMVSGRPLLGRDLEMEFRVWYLNLEDPREEVSRQIQAAALHYDLTPDDIGDRLYVDSGREQRFVIAEATPSGSVICRPIVDSIVSELKSKAIDVIVVDPFVSSHEVSENDNNAMDRVVKEWGRIAEAANCAVHLIHHTRKLASDAEVNVDSSRGGKALTDGCRSVRTINRMTKEEGEKADVPNYRFYFRTYNEKANLAPPAEHSDWFRLESVSLGNGVDRPSDEIGVTTTWRWPDEFGGVTLDDLKRVQIFIDQEEWRESPQADRWVGKAVAEALGIDLAEPSSRPRIKGLLRGWIESGALRVITAPGPDRKLTKFVEVGNWAE